MADRPALARTDRPDLPDLPVREVLGDLVDGLGSAGTAVLEAPPGAGKTTLVPLAIQAAGWCSGRVVVLEPRRLAARAAANRMAQLIGGRVGGLVGVTTREERRRSAATRVEVMTEGVLVRRLQRDPTLEGIAVVVLDEFHERSIEADLALAFALESRATVREDLRILVMSATLDGQRVADLLPGAHRVRSEGRVHDVETRHEPVPVDADVGHAVADAVRRVLPDAPGDVLAFLPGQREIRRAAAALSDLGIPVLPLYGALPPAVQQQALEPVPGGRRVVLATDIAESSLTVPGVRCVVDAGWSRRPRFDPLTGMSRLDTVRVATDSADQRRGRAAREGAGLCIRLWTATESLATHAPPAIMEQDLAPTALEITAWGTPVTQLALLDQPPAATWSQAMDLLVGLEAIDDGRLTDHGRAMAELPVHPRLAHMALAAAPHQRSLAARIAALLAERDILMSGDSDLELRLHALRAGRAGGGRQGALQRVRRDAERLERRLVRDAGRDRPRGQAERQDAPDTDAGALLALAYPDRIARRRDRRGAFIMAGGRGAVLPGSDSLAGQDLLAVAHVDRGDTDARIRLAAALDLEAVAHRIVERDHVAWEDSDVIARRRRMLGAMVLSESPLPEPDLGAEQAALLDGIRQTGLHILPWSRGARSLRDRLRHLHVGSSGSADEAWPAVDDDTLLGELETWLGPFLLRARRRADLARVDVPTALMSRVPHHLQGRLDQLAPSHLRVPSGSSIRLDYSGDRPVLAVKLQEMFGASSTPEVAGQPVRIHLLSPAGRPVQITDDLPGFWERGYPEVRAELRGRYAKHPWPEDPLAATPTRHTKRRAGQP